MRKIVATGIGLAVLIVLIISLSSPRTPAAAAQADRTVYKNSVVKLKLGATAAGVVAEALVDHSADKMRLMFSVTLPDDKRKKLSALVAEGKSLTPEVLAKEYGAKEDDAKKLQDWLQGAGFKILSVSKDNSAIFTEGTVGQIEKSLAVKMVRVTVRGRTYNAAQGPPSLPNEIAPTVQSINGLQEFFQVRKHSHRAPLATTPLVGGNAPPYLVPEVLKAYGADHLGVTGKNQTIAILIDTEPSIDDLKAFWKLNKVNQDATRYKTVNVRQVDLPPINSEQPEETLDAEWTSGIAPDAKIRLYAVGSLQFVDLNQGLQQILDDAQTDPTLRILSISLGANELQLGDLGAGGVLVPADIITAQQDLLLKLAALGVNVFVSSGDDGAFPSAGPAQVEFGASSPNVTAVGGTRLFLKTNGTVNHEFGWPGAGGGLSVIFDRPSWQKAAGLPTGPMRSVPDVSLVAADDTVARVVVNGVEGGVYGTSWSAPTWAGFCALLNEGREKADKPRLTFLPPQLYPLQSKKCFRDITKGSNGRPAGAGYDQITGLGVPVVSELMKELTK